jgi:alkylation response protein AidB-like acyl-CoA dehydrogenase
MTDEAMLAASRVADDILFPAALTTDAAERIPEGHLLALADAGLFGLRGPRSAGGLELGQEQFSPVVERLASGCLATKFVWLQHHTAVQALAESDNVELASEWLPEGHVPWVTGWSLIHTLYTVARSPDEHTVCVLLDPRRAARGPRLIRSGGGNTSSRPCLSRPWP